jgi:hypothetical protein
MPYLITPSENDAIEVFDIRGTAHGSVLNSLLEMNLTSELTKSDKGLYHAQICPAYGEDKAMDQNDWLKAAAILEDELKLSGQKRVIVLHEKQGRTHAHVVWERYDHDKGKMISDSYSRLAQDRARKTMERVLVQQQTPDRNKRRPDMKRELTALWQQANTGAEFLKAAREKGYTVAWCRNRRPFMVVDKEGRSFDLVRNLEGVRTSQLRETLKEERIPTDKKAIKAIRTRQSEKSFTKAQEDMADRIEQFQEHHAAKKQEQLLFADKRNEMKQEARRQTIDGTDKALNHKQDKFQQSLRMFRQQEDAKEKTASQAKHLHEPKPKRDRLKWEFKEQLQAAKEQSRKIEGPYL